MALNVDQGNYVCCGILPKIPGFPQYNEEEEDVKLVNGYLLIQSFKFVLGAQLK